MLFADVVNVESYFANKVLGLFEKRPFLKFLLFVLVKGKFDYLMVVPFEECYTR